MPKDSTLRVPLKGDLTLTRTIGGDGSIVVAVSSPDEMLYSETIALDGAAPGDDADTEPVL